MRFTHARKVFCMILVLAVMLVLELQAFAADNPPVYVRIRVSSKATVYVCFSGEEMRMACKLKELAEADVVKATETRKLSKTRMMSFPEVELPVPEKALPFKANKMKATFVFYESLPLVAGSFSLCVKDKEGVEWAYLWTARVEPARSPSKAPYFKIPDLRKVSLSVVVAPNSRQNKAGVGLRFMAGEERLDGILRNGEPVDVQVGIIAEGGREVTSASGQLSQFGFG